MMPDIGMSLQVGTPTCNGSWDSRSPDEPLEVRASTTTLTEPL
jgi:hypothetical protein